MTHQVIDTTGLKVYGEGKWKCVSMARRNAESGANYTLLRDAAPHAIVAAESNLEHIADNEVFPTLLNPLQREIEQVSGDGAYDTRACHALLKIKGIKASIPRARMPLYGKQSIHKTKPLRHSKPVR